MAKSLFDPAARGALLARIDRLDATAAPRWGKFTAPNMVSHLVEATRMALGEVPVTLQRHPMRLPPVRWLAIFVVPWPKGAATAPALLARAPQAWDSDVATLKALLERAGTKPATDRWAPHPLFGAMSGAYWGALLHRHVDHHLTQFGV